MKTYKGFNKDLKCRDFQYEIGKTYEMGGEIKCCKNGFHACENPIDVFGYYNPAESIFCEVEQDGKIDFENSDSKIASSKITIGAEINLFSIAKIGVEWILSKVDFKNNKKSNTGYRSAATNTGNRSAATNTGYQSAAVVEGMQSIAIAVGYNSRAKGIKSCWIVLSEWDEDGNIINVKSHKVDGKTIKPNTFYKLENNKFKECE